MCDLSLGACILRVILLKLSGQYTNKNSITSQLTRRRGGLPVLPSIDELISPPLRFLEGVSIMGEFPSNTSFWFSSLLNVDAVGVFSSVIFVWATISLSSDPLSISRVVVYIYLITVSYVVIEVPTGQSYAEFSLWSFVAVPTCEKLQLFGSIKDRVPSGPALTFIFISVRLFVTQHRPDSPTWEFKIRVSRVSNSDLLLLRDLMTLSL